MWFYRPNQTQIFSLTGKICIRYLTEDSFFISISADDDLPETHAIIWKVNFFRKREHSNDKNAQTGYFKIPCGNCEMTYVGETSEKFDTWLQHKQKWKLQQRNLSSGVSVCQVALNWSMWSKLQGQIMLVVYEVRHIKSQKGWCWIFAITSPNVNRFSIPFIIVISLY